MQKQKTVAKWLFITLLLIIGVGSYLTYDALYLPSVRNAAVGQDQDDTPNADGEKLATDADGDAQSQTDGARIVDSPDDSSADQDLSRHIPYHTSLPRQAEIIDGVTVMHVGGENNDTLLKTIAIGNKTLVFFESASAEYDVTASGLNLALFDNSTLTAVTHLSSKKFVDAKLFRQGVAVATADNTLTVLSFDGDIIAQTSLPDFDDGRFYLHEDNLQWFYTDGDYLKSLKVLDNVTLQSSPFLTKIGVKKIVETYAIGNDYTLFLQDDKSLDCYNFQQNNGFKLMFTLDKVSFVQMTASAGTDAPFFCLAYFDGKSMGIITYDRDYKITAQRQTDHKHCVLAPTADGIAVLTPNSQETYCRHLDRITATEGIDFDNVLAVTPIKDGIALVGEKDGKCFAYISSSKAFRDLGENVLGASVTVGGDYVTVSVTTTSRYGVFRANFGGEDVYMLRYPLNIR